MCDTCYFNQTYTGSYNVTGGYTGYSITLGRRIGQPEHLFLVQRAGPE